MRACVVGKNKNIVATLIEIHILLRLGLPRDSQNVSLGEFLTVDNVNFY